MDASYTGDLIPVELRTRKERWGQRRQEQAKKENCGETEARRTPSDASVALSRSRFPSNSLPTTTTAAQHPHYCAELRPVALHCIALHCNQLLHLPCHLPALEPPSQILPLTRRWSVPPSVSRCCPSSMTRAEYVARHRTASNRIAAAAPSP